MKQSSIDLRKDPVKKTLDRLLSSAAIAEAKRIEKSVPLPDQEAQQLANAVVLASGQGVVVRLVDVLGQKGGYLVAQMEIVTPKMSGPKSKAKKYFTELMKTKGRWRSLGSTSLTFATKVKVPAMENLSFATPDFLGLYDLKSAKLKYSVEVFLFGAVEKLSVNDDDDSDVEASDFSDKES